MLPSHPTRRPSPGLLRLLVALLLSATLGAATAADAPRDAPVPGGVARVSLGEAGERAPRASFRGSPVLVTRAGDQWQALVGLALDTRPGTEVLQVRGAGGAAREVAFEVRDKRYPEQRITLRDKAKVELSPADLARVKQEQAEIGRIKRTWTEAGEVDLDFALPAAGPLSSRFGLRRYFNDQPRAPHAGLDVAVPKGAPILASAAGRVVAAADYFFNGNTVFVDHGLGLLTMYCHLDRVDVRAGDAVRRGQRLGAAGMTGRATGPHLHWSVILNGAMVDPELFLPTAGH